ncbi:MAG: hypothetical protein F4203_00540 [Rhodobacteraceae bacterium]|nr:hypothetical protein [Paracoccaceae bacterium]
MLTFAIISDTHIRPKEGDLSSPFKVNLLANDRARYAVALIKSLKPEFTVHLGDVVHPLYHMKSYDQAWGMAREILEPLEPKLYFVPGNHDIGDKTIMDSPAKPINEISTRTYEKHQPEQRFSFETRGTLCVGINSSLFNSGTVEEEEQKDWLTQTLINSKAKTKILFSHYPPMICHQEEEEHYDNYDPLNRLWLLELAAQTNVDIIFSGHVHHFFFNRYKGVKLFCLPSTCFTRQDYAEMFSIQPAPEFGRNDTPKLGVTMVEITDDGPKVSIIGTDGLSMESGQKQIVPRVEPRKTPLIPHLRHGIHTARLLPYNGPMEEFSRKEARNDYPLLRLLQLGIEVIRVPGTDLAIPQAKKRLEDWCSLGGKVVPFFLGIQDDRLLKQFTTTFSGEIRALEFLVSSLEEMIPLGNQLGSIPRMNIPIWVSKISSSSENLDPDSLYSHTVSSGFYPEELSALPPEWSKGGWSGIVVQCPWEKEPIEYFQETLPYLPNSGMDLVVNIRLAKSNPSEGNFCQEAIKTRIDYFLEKSSQNKNMHLLLDTFEDIDRGYNPRYGLIDRLGNLRWSKFGIN